MCPSVCLSVRDICALSTLSKRAILRLVVIEFQFRFRMGIVDEMISNSQGQTSYTVMVKSFVQKMDTWAPGRVIRLS